MRGHHQQVQPKTIVDFFPTYADREVSLHTVVDNINLSNKNSYFFYRKNNDR